MILLSYYGIYLIVFFKGPELIRVSISKPGVFQVH